jgi:predicted enzyme related to lactoylglutathione lyase
MHPWWTTYISVADVQQSADAVVANGGSVQVPPMDVLDAGRLAVVTDPGGAGLSLWQPRRHIGAGIVNEVNTFCWNELFTREPARSIEFYSAVFGWRPHHHGDSDGDYVEFHLEDRSVAGMIPTVGDMWSADMPNHWMVSFAVDDVDESATRAEELGGGVAVPPSENLWGRFAVLIDPQGAVFSIITYRLEAA